MKLIAPQILPFVTVWCQHEEGGELADLPHIIALSARRTGGWSRPRCPMAQRSDDDLIDRRASEDQENGPEILGCNGHRGSLSGEAHH